MLSQRWQASMHNRQCSWWSACSAQVSPHCLHDVAQASRILRVTAGVGCVRRESTLPVAAQISAQSRSSRMHLTSVCISCSPRQA